MSSIFSPRSYFKPFEYPWAFEFYLKQQQMHWTPEEVPLHEDVKDWNQKLSNEEKNLLTQIFRFFTQSDSDVSEGYNDKIIPLFKKPEVRMMLNSFANMEGVHQHAYSLLLDTVAMPESEYKAFSQYEEMAKKHEYISKFKPDNLREVIKTIAVYSAFTEGLQLFSSFAILLNFPRTGKLKGMGQIITWSIRDESLHVEGMIKLFRQIVEENFAIWDDELKREVYGIAKEMIDMEDKFIDLAFEQGGIEGLTSDDVKQYIRYICDRRLLQLGLKPNYGIKNNPLEWLDWMLNGSEHSNFFEQRSTEYNKGMLKGSWSDVFG